MLVNYSVRFQGQSNGFYSESVAVTVTEDDLHLDEASAKNRAAVEADLTYQAVRGCLQAVVLAGGMDETTAKHRLKPFRRMRDKQCYGEISENKT